MSEQTESKGVEKLIKEVDAAELIKKIDKMIKSKKSNILMVAYQQGEIFRRFKTDSKFISTVSAFKISKTKINFKIDIVKYLKMQTSCISLFI